MVTDKIKKSKQKSTTVRIITDILTKKWWIVFNTIIFLLLLIVNILWYFYQDKSDFDLYLYWKHPILWTPIAIFSAIIVCSLIYSLLTFNSKDNKKINTTKFQQAFSETILQDK